MAKKQPPKASAKKQGGTGSKKSCAMPMDLAKATSKLKPGKKKPVMGY